MRTNHNITFCLLLVFSIFVERAEACGQCVDKIIRISYPLLGFAMLMFFIWLALVMGIKRKYKGRIPEKSSYVPTRIALISFAIIGTVGYIGISMCSMGSVLFPCLAVSTIWLIYVVAHLLVAFKRFPSKGIEQSCFALNAGALIAVITLGVADILYTHNRSIDTMINLCDRHIMGTQSILMPRIISKGEPAIHALIRSTEVALASEKDYLTRREEKLCVAVFCLAKIGGVSSESYLRSLVKEKVRFQDFKENEWQKYACAAYAEVARERAVSDLIELYNRLDQEKWIPLAALVKTASPSGIEFALNHMNTLLDRTETGGSGTDVQAACQTVQILMDMKGKDQLKTIPLYLSMCSPDATLKNLDTEFYWSQDLPWGDKAQYAVKWAQRESEIRNYWMGQFKNKELNHGSEPTGASHGGSPSAQP